MAGDDNGDGIIVIGGSDGAAGLRLADGAGDVSVGRNLAVRNSFELPPDLLLECSALGLQREGEYLDF